MTTHGLLIGMGLLGLVTLVAWALGARANRGVRQFREEQHEAFRGPHPP